MKIGYGYPHTESERVYLNSLQEKGGHSFSGTVSQMNTCHYTDSQSFDASQKTQSLILGHTCVRELRDTGNLF